MAKAIRWLVVLVALAAVSVGAYAWLQNQTPETAGFKLVEVTTGSITEKALAVGQIEPRVKFAVKSKISGIVKRCLVEVGDTVKAGAPLFEIIPDPTPSELLEARGRVEQAEAGFRLAESELRRSSQLFTMKILARKDLDMREEEYERARIELDRAKDAFALLKKGKLEGGGMESIIRAPAGGIVLARNVDPGDPVVPLTSFQEGTELASIADMSDLVFEGTVDEIDVGKLSVGLVARLKIGALPDDIVLGTLTRIAPQATERDGARLFGVDIELAEDQDVQLRAGYSATADLIIQEKTEITLVPERLVTFGEEGDKPFVELPGNGPEAEPVKREVTLGLSDGLNIEVIDGLAAGEQLVERPPREITAG